MSEIEAHYIRPSGPRLLIDALLDRSRGSWDHARYLALRNAPFVVRPSTCSYTEYACPLPYHLPNKHLASSRCSTHVLRSITVRFPKDFHQINIPNLLIHAWTDSNHGYEAWCFEGGGSTTAIDMCGLCFWLAERE